MYVHEHLRLKKYDVKLTKEKLFLNYVFVLTLETFYFKYTPFIFLLVHEHFRLESLTVNGERRSIYPSYHVQRVQCS